MSTRLDGASVMLRHNVRSLGFALSERNVASGYLVECDHDVIRRHTRGRGNSGVYVLQECKPCLLRAPLNEGDIQKDQIVRVAHSEKRWRVEKPRLRQREDHLEKIIGRYMKYVHERRLDGAGYF